MCFFVKPILISKKGSFKIQLRVFKGASFITEDQIFAQTVSKWSTIRPSTITLLGMSLEIAIPCVLI